MNSICVVSYNRLELLKETLEGITRYCTKPYELIIVDNNSDLEVQEYIIKFVSNLDIENTVVFNKENLGAAVAFGQAFRIANGNVLIHMDSDILVPFEGWNQRLEQFLGDHPEVGLVGPDTPGSCLRLPREDGFEETEFVLGACWAMRKKDVSRYGGWSEKYKDGGAIEVEHCYRLRMKGFRVGLLTTMSRIHLDKNPSSGSVKYAKGTFDFMKEINEYHLGFFHYKSPEMLYWEDLPINVLFRRQVFALQSGLNLYPQKVVIQNHNFELIQVPSTIGHYNELGLRDLVKKGRIMRGSDKFSDISKELLTGQIKWNLELEEEMNKRRNDERP